MASETKLILTFDDSGKFTMEAFGFKGDQCLKETKELEELLGKVTSRTKKQEAYSPKPVVKIGSK